MPTTYKGQECVSFEEMRSMLKAQNHKRAAEIPEILKQQAIQYRV